jgi:hypothetical protein
MELMSKHGKYNDGTLYNLFAYVEDSMISGVQAEQHYKEALTFPEYLSWRIHYEKLGLKVRFIECTFGDGIYE